MLLLILVSSLAYAACGGDNNGIPPLPPAPAGGQPGGGGEPLTATLKGKISWEGEAPKVLPQSTSADPNCKNDSLVKEQYVVSDGGLENVIIYVSSDVPANQYAAKTETVQLDQKGCHYIPHALTLQTNQPLNITNSDETAHNVHAWAMINMSFNEAQAHKGDSKLVKFDKEEMHFPIKCDVHNWMNAFVGVFKHPMHTVSKKGGAFEMKLAKGKWDITAIHEDAGMQTKSVEVADGATADLNFTFKAK